MSAGQAQDSSFQLCIWDNNGNVIVHLNNVYFRDVIRVYLGDCENNLDHNQGRWCVLHGKGEKWNEEAGQVDLHWR